MQSRTILITGGSRGLGRAMTVALSAESHKVAFTGRSAEMLAETKDQFPGEALAMEADVTDYARAKEVIEEVETKLGPVDVLINNAGVLGEGGPVWETDVDEWWKVHETNLKGPLNYCHAAIPSMLGRRSGMVINVGSYTCMRPNPGNPAYATSKIALSRFSDSLAAQLEGTGVDVFCVSPGLVATDMTRDVEAFKSIPTERWNQPEDIGQIVCKLVSGGYSALNGRFFHVKDDIDAMLANADRIREENLFEFRMSNLDGQIG